MRFPLSVCLTMLALALPAQAQEGAADAAPGHQCASPGDIKAATTSAQQAEYRKRLTAFKACIDKFVTAQEAAIARIDAAIKAAVSDYNNAALAYNASLQKKDK